MNMVRLKSSVSVIAFDSRDPWALQLAVAAAIRAKGPVTVDEMLKRSPDTAKMLDYWDKTDAIIDGEDALRLCGERYLPRFSDESAEEYQDRLKLTKLTNIFSDVVEGLSSKPFEEEVSLVEEDDAPAPEEIKKFIEDVDGSGSNLTVFGSTVFFHGIKSAIDWIYIDYPKADTAIRSVADVKASGRRPYWSRVLARNVLWPKSEIVNGKEVLTYVRIFEPGNGEKDRVREFMRSPDGKINWRLFEKSDQVSRDGKTQFVEIDRGMLSINVIPLVPFATGRRVGRTFEFKPALKAAADLQIQLWQDESALKFVKNMAGYPMLSAQGIKPPMAADGKTPLPVKTGPRRILYGGVDSAGRAGEWKFIEPGAQTMQFLASDVKETIQNLRELGRQPLTAQTGNLTVITTSVAANKARSAVGAWALGLKNALENALVITAMYFGLNENDYASQVNVFNEFDDTRDQTTDLTALENARRSGDLSRKTYWYELKRRGVLSPEFEDEAEESRLLEEIPGDGIDTGDDDPAPVDPVPPDPVE